MNAQKAQMASFLRLVARSGGLCIETTRALRPDLARTMEAAIEWRLVDVLSGRLYLCHLGSLALQRADEAAR